jgi:hypothetical protein
LYLLENAEDSGSATLKRRTQMNLRACTLMPEVKHQAPLFASPWMALFFTLRRELKQSRQSA